jgi:hypothetical protein
VGPVTVVTGDITMSIATEDNNSNVLDSWWQWTDDITTLIATEDHISNNP